MIRRLATCSFPALLFLIGCTHNWGTFRTIRVVPPENVQALGEPVEGEDCSWVVGRWWWRSVAEASRQALLKAPGAVGLTNVEVRWTQGFLNECIQVRGTPVRPTDAALATPGP